MSQNNRGKVGEDCPARSHEWQAIANENRTNAVRVLKIGARESDNEEIVALCTRIANLCIKVAGEAQEYADFYAEGQAA